MNSKKEKMAYENLFNYMAKEHGLNLLQEEMQEIERMVKLDEQQSGCQLAEGFSHNIGQFNLLVDEETGELRILLNTTNTHIRVEPKTNNHVVIHACR